MTTALYRRYRPDTFKDVIGQEHVTEPLMAALRKNRVNHAYLFSGPRGCGKTTSARILARCLNCAQGPTDTPCGTCESCVELATGGSGSLDVIEIDAASHGGVDDARDLRERATFAPVRDRYKIFIIDEAHMVTSAGFNALLKIVEEPPEHIKFIFATTEPDKVIGTIRSRTHHYPFRLVPPEPLMNYLSQLCEREQVAVAPGVLSLVIRAGGGSVRDTLSVLDQLMAGAGKNGLDYELAVALLGYTHASLLDDVVEALAAADAGSVFRCVDRVVQTGLDPRRFVEDLLERFRDLVIVAAVPENAASILRGTPEDQINRLRSQAGQMGHAELSRAADVCNEALTEMTGATSPRLHLELLCARLLLPAAEQGERSLATRLDRVERRLSYGAPSGSAVAASAQPAATTSAPVTPALPVTSPVTPPVSAKAVAPTHDAGRPAQAPTAPRAPARHEEAQPAASSRPQQPIQPERSAQPERPAQPEQPAAPVRSAEPAQAAPTESTSTADQPASSAAASTNTSGDWGAWGSTEMSVDGQVTEAAVKEEEAEAAAWEKEETQPQPAQSSSAAASGAQTGSVEMIRRAWPDILDALGKIKRSSWALVSQNATPAGFDGSTLSVGFSTSGLAGTFTRGDHSDNLRQAVKEVLGIDCRLEPSVGDASGSSAPNPKAPAASTKAAYAPCAEEPEGPHDATEPEPQHKPEFPQPEPQQVEPNWPAEVENSWLTRVSDSEPANKPSPPAATSSPAPVNTGNERIWGSDQAEASPAGAAPPSSAVTVPTQSPATQARAATQAPTVEEFSARPPRVQDPGWGDMDQAPSWITGGDDEPAAATETGGSEPSGRESNDSQPKESRHSSGQRSRYQQMSAQAKAERQAADAIAAQPTDEVEDYASEDDELAENSSLMGKAAVERILGGKLIEERPNE